MVAFTQLSIGMLCLLSLLHSVVSAAPMAAVDINKSLRNESSLSKDFGVLNTRAPGDSFIDPIDATFDITGWESIAEQDCYVMICLMHGRRVFQKQHTMGAGNQAYRDSGAELRPFAADELARRGTSQINPETTSAEEFPWRTILLQDDELRYLGPATDSQQTSQAGRLTAGYFASHVGYGQWFRITLTGNLGLYCRALMNNDIAPCLRKSKEELFDTSDVFPGDDIYYKNGRRGGVITFVKP